MRPFRQSLIALIVCIATSLAAAQDAREMVTQEKLKALLRKNVAFTNPADMDQRLLPGVSGYFARNKSVTVMIGAEMSVRRKPLYLITYGGDPHLFELTPAQARGLGMRPASLITQGISNIESEMRLANPIFALSNLTIKDADGAPGNRNITGSFVCKPTGQAINGALNLSITFRRPDQLNRVITPLTSEQANGTVPFTIDALNRGQEELQFGPTPVFVDILISRPGGRMVYAGNTVSMMVNVLPDIESFAKNGLAVMNRFVDLLASVKDRESAARVKDEYVRFALQNKALGEAMERIAPQSKEQDAEFERQHGAELDAVTKRMKAEYERLQQADYAGDAFFDQLDAAVKAAQ